TRHIFILVLFFQAEDCIRDRNVTGVQTCALPISEEIIKTVAEQYKDIDGVEYSVEYGDEEAVENIEINYEELDYEKAQKTDGIMLQGDPEKGISMEKSAEMIEEQGYTEVEE